MTPTHNGVTLGANSPLLTLGQAKRKLEPLEEDMQIELFALLVGPAVKGQPRIPGAGMTVRYPELRLLYAIPNGGFRHKRTAGRMKAQGVLGTIPDLSLPVMRGPFCSLFVELKKPSTKPTAEQAAMHELLRAEGHCVVVCRNVQDAVDVIVGYLTLPKNRPSVRPIGGSGPIEHQLHNWRLAAMALIAPKPPR